MPETSVLTSAPPWPTKRTASLKVLVVDDSPVIRRLIIGVLESEPGIEVVGFASDGASALEQIGALDPDVVTLDVEMPGMDGLETLRRIRERNGKIRIVMFSSLTERGAPTTLKALIAGASDYCAKPSQSSSPAKAKEYLHRELIPKVMQFTPRPSMARPASQPTVAAPAQSPCVWVIGVSTGGPQTLNSIIPKLPGDFPAPVLIVQHMPAQFTTLLAKRLDNESQLQVEEAAEGQLVKPGHVLFAPGGYHLRVARRGGDVVALLDQSPPENSCRPAVDVLFRSVAEVWGGQVVCTILTGMGQDGLRGTRLLKQQGAHVVAQDENSSIVWGMPGAVVHAGLADEVLALPDIVPAILRRWGRA